MIGEFKRTFTIPPETKLCTSSGQFFADSLKHGLGFVPSAGAMMPSSRQTQIQHCHADPSFSSFSSSSFSSSFPSFSCPSSPSFPFSAVCPSCSLFSLSWSTLAPFPSMCSDQSMSFCSLSDEFSSFSLRFSSFRRLISSLSDCNDGSSAGALLGIELSSSTSASSSLSWRKIASSSSSSSSPLLYLVCSSVLVSALSSDLDVFFSA
mmetsp:Transcript_16158/g.54120  ORF Transcript_16158/g.54120 Transcript_16158/m.54120 type:complete len:207 (+) Transcript_16158:221-841(+)